MFFVRLQYKLQDISTTPSWKYITVVHDNPERGIIVWKCVIFIVFQECLSQVWST